MNTAIWVRTYCERLDVTISWNTTARAWGISARLGSLCGGRAVNRGHASSELGVETSTPQWSQIGSELELALCCLCAPASWILSRLHFSSHSRQREMWCRSRQNWRSSTPKIKNEVKWHFEEKGSQRVCTKPTWRKQLQNNLIYVISSITILLLLNEKRKTCTPITKRKKTNRKRLIKANSYAVGFADRWKSTFQYVRMSFCPKNWKWSSSH